MNHLRILALDPTIKGFAYAVLEGNAELLDWGLAQPRVTSGVQSIRRITALFARYEPDLVVLEEGEDSRRGARAKRFVANVRALAQARGIAIRSVSRAQVREAFKPSGTTKHEIALEVVRRYRYLALRLPRRRKPWMSEDARMSIFDAMSFALTVLWTIKRSKNG